MSIRLEADDGGTLPTPLPGQYLTVKIPDAGDPPPMRSYSLSGDPAEGYYRISVKREDHGQVSQWLHGHAKTGMIIESAAPRGDFYLVDDGSPVILVSAGIGATPVMAMAHALAAAKSPRQIWWLHTTQSTATHAFAAEVTALLDSAARRSPACLLHPWRRRADASRPAVDRRAGPADRRRRHTSAAPLRSWTTCVTPSWQPGSIPPTSTPNCSAPCRRSTPAWWARRRPCGHTLPKACRGRGRESPSPAADSASTGHPASTPSSNSRRRATCQPGIHAEAASATRA